MTNQRSYSGLYVILTAIFCTALVVSNVIAGKVYQGPGGLIVDAGTWLFPIVYIIGDVLPDVYGFKTARRTIFLGFLANIFAVTFFMITIKLPYPSFWTGQQAFETVLGFTPRLLIASMIAYLCGTNLNAWVLVAIKKMTGGRWLWMRTIGSTIVGETVDSALFVTIAFLGVIPFDAVMQMVVTQAVFKILYETLATPLTYAVINAVKQAEYGTTDEKMIAVIRAMTK